MKKDIIVEINRIKEMMGLISEQEQTNESWQSVARGKPYKLLYRKYQGEKGYFSSPKTREYIASFPKEDTKITFKNICPSRISVDSLPEQTRINLLNKNKFELSLIEEDFLYGTGRIFSLLKISTRLIQKNPDYDLKLGKLCLSGVIMGYIEKNINNDVKITLNGIRNLKPITKSAIRGTNYFGTTIPGLSEEVLTQFMQFIDTWVERNANGNYTEQRLSERIKKGGIKLILGRPQESVSSEAPSTKSFDSVVADFKITGEAGSPFENNKSDLTPLTLGIINNIANNIRKTLAENPNVKARVLSKVKVDNTEKDVPFTIRTSASRLMNTNEAADKTFLQLSQERSQRVYETMQQILGPLLEGGLPKPIMDFDGTNGDGSSGPNPPKGYSVTTDGKKSTSYKDGTAEANRERNKFGPPPTKIEDLNQYKYCIIQIAIEFFSQEESKEENPEMPDQIFVGKWTFDIDPGHRQKKHRKKWNIRIDWPDWDLDLPDFVGKYAPCEAYR